MFGEVRDAETCEKRINFFRLDFDFAIYITVSNAKLLMGEFATNLAGRYVEFLIYPFLFEDFL